MRALAGELLLTAWEDAQGAPEIMRPLRLLGTALVGTNADRLAELPLAQRNALLLELRGLSFGPSMQGFADCPACGARLEFALSVESMLGGIGSAVPLEWSEQGRAMRVRPANTLDLCASLQAADTQEGRRILLSRCVEANDAEDADTNQTIWIARFDEVNAGAEMRCVLDCPDCQAHPALDFDIARFLWHEVRAAARTLLGEIHLLASTYSWTQDAILALTPTRRRAYMEMLTV